MCAFAARRVTCVFRRTSRHTRASPAMKVTRMAELAHEGLRISRDKRERERELLCRTAPGAPRSPFDQHGLITTPQLRALGFDQPTVSRCVRESRLHRVHRGIYLVFRPGVTKHVPCLAAVLAMRESAVLSHLSAAALPSAAGARSADDRRHRPIEPPPTRRHPPIHTPSLQPVFRRRTLRRHDASHHTDSHLPLPRRDVCRRTLTYALRAGQRHATSTRSPSSPLCTPCPSPYRDRPRPRGPQRLRARAAPGPLRARAGVLRAYASEHCPPLPLVNVPIAAYEADFVWPDLALIVETDGDAWHRTDVDRVRDAERDAIHRALGYTVFRVPEPSSDRPRALPRIERGCGSPRGSLTPRRGTGASARRRGYARDMGLRERLIVLPAAVACVLAAGVIGVSAAVAASTPDTSGVLQLAKGTKARPARSRSSRRRSAGRSTASRTSGRTTSRASRPATATPSPRTTSARSRTST